MKLHTNTSSKHLKNSKHLKKADRIVKRELEFGKAQYADWLTQKFLKQKNTKSVREEKVIKL